MNGTLRSARGFSLVSAVFLLVVLSLLGTMMVSLSTTQQYTVAYALQGARAYHAAHSGLEWGIGRAVGPAGICGAANIVLGGELGNFQVAVTCSATNHSEHGDSFSIYTIVSTATSTNPGYGEPGYAARELKAVVTNAPSP